MTTRSKPGFTIAVVCPICGVTWAKPIHADVRIQDDEAVMRMLSRPTCCSQECRNKLYIKGRWKFEHVGGIG